MSQPGARVGLYWAWLMLDRFRASQAINPHQIEFALKAIESVLGRRPISGSPTYEFHNESALRGKHASK
jgi:hypothetical protein